MCRQKGTKNHNNLFSDRQPTKGVKTDCNCRLFCSCAHKLAFALKLNFTEPEDLTG